MWSFRYSKLPIQQHKGLSIKIMSSSEARVINIPT